MRFRGDFTTISLAAYRAYFVARERLDLPFYLGSTLRGAFGLAFRQLACPSRFNQPCPIPSQCAYHLVFESSPPSDSKALRTHDEIPRPFVIAPEWRSTDWGTRLILSPGEEFCFELKLIGRAQEFFPHFVITLREMDRIGRGRRATKLNRIEAIDPRDGAARIVYESSDNLVREPSPALALEDCLTGVPAKRIAIEFVTQTRLKHEGSWVRLPEFHIVFRRLLGRLSSMARFHCDDPLEVDFRGLIDRAREIRLIRDGTRWISWSRYSNRQARKMQWEGLVGIAIYEGDLSPFWPYLKFGQHIHVGHGATFGLGRYRIWEEAGIPDGQTRGH